MKKIETSLIFLILVFLPALLFASEEITFTTYYPSPYGSYNDLQANRMAVGDVNGDSNLDENDLPANIDELAVASRIGIGTRTPLARLYLHQEANKGINIRLFNYVALGGTYSGWGTVLGNNVKADDANARNRMVNIVDGAYGGSAIYLQGNDGITFHTKTGNAANAGRDTYDSPQMKITSDGKVGIGTTSPATGVKLEVVNSNSRAQLGYYEVSQYRGCSGGQYNIDCNRDRRYCELCCGGSFYQHDRYTYCSGAGAQRNRCRCTRGLQVANNRGSSCIEDCCSLENFNQAYGSAIKGTLTDTPGWAGEFEGDVRVTGLANIGGNLAVGGTATVANSLTVGGDLGVGGKITASNIVSYTATVWGCNQTACSYTVNFPRRFYPDTPTVTCSAGPNARRGWGVLACMVVAAHLGSVDVTLDSGGHDQPIVGEKNIYIIAHAN